MSQGFSVCRPRCLLFLWLGTFCAEALLDGRKRDDQLPFFPWLPSAIQPPPPGMPLVAGTAAGLHFLPNGYAPWPGPAPGPAPAPMLDFERPMTMALAVAGPPAVSRDEVCEVCYRECAVNCFVGTCGLEYPMGVYRFSQSNQCYSCDAVTANNVPGADRFELCSSEQAKAPPPITFSLTMDEATKEASMHRTAAQIRASQSLAISDAAQQAWKTAADRYNSLLPRLRAFEMQVADAKQAMDHAAMLAAKTKGQYFDDTRSLQAAVNAQTEAAIAAANRAQAAAMKDEGEANPNMAEYRRLLVAQDEAAKQYQAAAEAALKAMPTEAPKPVGLDSGVNANAPGSAAAPPCVNQTLLVGLRQAQSSGPWQGAPVAAAAGRHQPALPPLDYAPQDMAVAFLQPAEHRKVAPA